MEIFELIGWLIAFVAYVTLFIYIGIKVGGIKITKEKKDA